MKEQIKKFGGIMWDTLFILIKDNDAEFILEFVNRIPCEECKFHFFKKIKAINLQNLDKEKLYIVLWKIRTRIDPKYQNKNTMTDLKEYLKYLQLI